MRLASLEASDMLDVIHYLFEDDVLSASGDHIEYKDTFRDNLYGEMYKYNYKYKTRSETDGSYGLSELDSPLDSDTPPVDESEKIKVFSPREKTAKPYIPPTQISVDDVKPFGSVLDAPIN